MNEGARTARFERLAHAWSADLFRFALWLCGQEALARDLVQETFLRAWKALDSLESDEAAKPWLITILRREYARTFERKQLPMAEVDMALVAEDSGAGPEERAERALLRRGILQLPDKYREPLLLQAVLGLSCKEIARELDLSEGAVMTQLFRAREQLKAQLQSDGVTGNVHGLF